MQRGKFIVLEGGEGAGKTTVAKALKEILTPKEFLVTRAGGSPFGEKLRALFVSDEAALAAPESRFSLAFAAQADHIRNIVAPALAAGRDVISDRLDASIFSYQVCGENKTQLKPLFWQTRKALFAECVPDLYIFLDVGLEEGFNRAKKEGRAFDHFERRPADFHERIREGYKAFFKTVPHVIVDANRSLEVVEQEVLQVLKQHLTWGICNG